MQSRRINSKFQSTVNHINLLSFDKDKLDGFIEVYLQAVEDIYNEMYQIRNFDKVLEGVYRARAEMLKTMLQRQITYFGLEWPDTTKKATSSSLR